MTRPANDNRAWQLIRLIVLAHYGNVCMRCGHDGDKAERNCQVDHILPVESFPDLATDPDNLQVLCPDCNADKGTDVSQALDYRPIDSDLKRDLRAKIVRELIDLCSFQQSMIAEVKAAQRLRRLKG